ncbi:MAG: amino acid-binding ACT domain protein [Candidatus Micrarchaeota archaeon]
MYPLIEEKFNEFPSRRIIITVMLKYGLSVDEKGRIFCGQIEMSPVKIGRATGCDRRVVIETARMIAKDKGLYQIFSKLRPTSFIGEGAKNLGFGFIEIFADSIAVGIVARVTRILAKEGIMIRQIVADDPEIYPEPKLTIVTDKKLPSKVIPEIQKIRGIRRISLE